MFYLKGMIFFMPVMDEFKEEREAMRQKSFKKKWEYFWYYYKWYVIGGVVLIFFAATFLYGRLTEKETILSGIALNSNLLNGEEKAEELLTDFTTYLQLNPAKNEAFIKPGLYMTGGNVQEAYEANQYITLNIAVGELDICLMDEDNFISYAYDSTFADLTTCLDASLQSSLSDKFFYVDCPVEEEYHNRQDNNISTDDMVFPAGNDPENMEQPYPVGIDISGCTKLMEAYGYDASKGPIYLGIVRNTERMDASVKFVSFLFSSSENSTLPPTH